MKKLSQIYLISVALTFLGYAASAADNDTSRSSENYNKMAILGDYAKGLDVETEDGVELGKLGDFIVDLETGNIRLYLIESGFLGFGPTRAVPADSISVSFGRDNKLVYADSEERFNDIAEYDESKSIGQNLARDERFTRHKKYPVADSDQADEGKLGTLRAMELVDQDVYTSDGTHAGQVDDWVINTSSGTLNYIIVKDLIPLGSTINPYEYHMVSRRVIEKLDNNNDMHLSVSMDDFSNAPMVSESDFIKTVEKGDTIVFRFNPSNG